jgi:ABC-type uncharacterized transport system substrate-binding protein
MFDTRRREFITMLGGAAAWPLVVRAQQPAMPVIAFLSDGRPAQPLISALREGLAAAGYVEGRNLKLEYHWANNQEEQLPAMAVEIAGLHVSVIVAFGSPVVAFAAKQATATIPIVIAGGINPVTYGLVASLNRPGGNITGVTAIVNELAGKRFELLCEMVPEANTIGYLSGGARRFAEEVTNIRAAARALGRQIIVLEASRDDEIEAAFARLVQLRAGALIVGVAPYLFYNSDKVLLEAARHKIPAILQSFVGVPRRADDLRRQSPGPFSPSERRLRCAHPQGRQSRRLAGSTAHKIRACHQSEDRQSARPRHPVHPARPSG